MDAVPDLTCETIETPIGDLLLIADGNGALRIVEFADCRHRMDCWLARRFRSGSSVIEGRVSEAIKASFAAYFDGNLAVLEQIPVALDGTAFQIEVWSALRRIVPGRTFAYGAFAESLGRPQSARAVGHANGANPLSIVIPCHRLVGADGALTNYGGGIERKRWLLEHEARHAVGLV
ncbi:methylated-DNA--[protein]-cysteine S-methyltransferase [Mesorhizobium sp. BAC0120]|uniref:methylated-DNA--[protein]-cysteine S-methyltransferase n=1 Tax=Mesorhizobium sp. BAC0120 TaxID=3090670 RepID=UPI00298C91CF|nr:methylated-DNA--[protein]-cysteine S-methyltransferase [Mesorhizobium sp. BAC0120]MDW6023798.1 methylated-DNA--[protein]-cysteine S-methyltransferase [Mesorhizobium sp. BAC0120]